VKVRNRRAGDYLTINSDMDKKSLKDYLIDSKVAREKRDSIPVIADDSHILWVVGLRISEYYKVSDTTKRILEISVK
jgi:tRNA(Ile)-lysidine synthase